MSLVLKSFKDGVAKFDARTDLGDGRSLTWHLEVVQKGNGVEMSVDCGSYEAPDLTTGRKRLAMWFRSMAQVLDGEEVAGVPSRIIAAPVTYTEKSEPVCPECGASGLAASQCGCVQRTNAMWASRLKPYESRRRVHYGSGVRGLEAACGFLDALLSTNHDNVTCSDCLRHIEIENEEATGVPSKREEE